MSGAPATRAVAAAGALCLLAGHLLAQAPVTITEFPIGGNPIPLAVGSDGNVWTWFSGTTSIGRMTPSGVSTIYSTALSFPSALPGHCVDGRDGGMWCSNTGGDIVRVSIQDGSSTVFPMPPGAGASDLTLGPDGALWFPDFGQNAIGRMTLGGAVTEFAIPPAFLAPRFITVGPDNALWFAGDNAQIGRIDVHGGGFRYYATPEFPNNASAAQSAICAGPDGNLWLGITPLVGVPRMYRVTPGGVVTGFDLPNAADGVVDIVVGPDRALWFTEESANQIGRITTSGQITEYDLAASSGPVGIARGNDGAIWFTELAGRIGRISGGPLTPTAVPTLGSAALFALVAALACAGWILSRN